MSQLIKNATVVTGGSSAIQDVYIDQGMIIAVGEGLDVPGAEVMDASGLHLLYGALDPQVHFRDPGLEWKEDLHTGSMAAAAGGVTAFFEMPNTKPNTIDAESMAAKKKIASEKCVVNYNFFIGATGHNLDEINSVPNVPGIKIFMGSSTGDLLVCEHEKLEEIFANGTRLIAVHAEDEAAIQANIAAFAGTTDPHDHYRIRNPEAALLATREAVELSHKYNRRLHILHLTSKDEVEYLRKEKTDKITIEVCPQHFLLKAPDDYDRLGTYVQMNPPVRTAEHGEALWAALKEGLIDIMATDHAPHTIEEKEQPYGKAPSGMPGVETLMPLMFNQVNKGLCTIEEVSTWCCEKPYDIYRVKNKGRIAAGYDADLVLVDLNKEKTVKNGELYNKANWSPYNGWTLKGWPVLVLVHGEKAFADGKVIDSTRGREVQFED
jgi:dihydroorotase